MNWEILIGVITYMLLSIPGTILWIRRYLEDYGKFTRGDMFLAIAATMLGPIWTIIQCVVTILNSESNYGFWSEPIIKRGPAKIYPPEPWPDPPEQTDTEAENKG